MERTSNRISRVLGGFTLLVVLTLDGQAAAQSPVSVPVDPRATYLRTGDTTCDSPAEPTIVDLTDHGFAPGDRLKLSYSVEPPGFSFICGNPAFLRTAEQTGVLGVFSSSSTLLSPSVHPRVPDAIDAEADVSTGPAFFCSLPNDIPQDFHIFPPSGFPIQIPDGATHLFLGLADSYYADNCGSLTVTLERDDNCRDQVQVNSFTPLTTTGLRARPIKNNTLTVTTDHKNAIAGIEFEAQITIKSGAIPIDKINIRYIQNQTAGTLTADYSPDPDLIEVLVPGATFPLLDKLTDPPPPFYDGGFDEDTPDGSTRIVTAFDTPEVDAPVTLTNPSRRLKGVDGRWMFRMYLGCISDSNPTFQTVATLDWAVRWLGTVSPAQEFKAGKGAGISAQSYLLGTESPVQGGTLAQDAFGSIENSP